MLRSIHLNPTARVYNLRALLVATAALIVWSVIHAGHPGLAWGIIMWIHHIVAVFEWPLLGLALIDLVAVIAEMMGLVLFIDTFLPVRIAPLILLFMSCFFRIATILDARHGPEGLLIQPLRFLGGCTQTNPPYNPASILLNRSLARPLVRGESKYIIIARAVILSCLWIGVPAFGIYATIIKPAAAVISTTSISNAVSENAVPGNASVYLEPDTYNDSWEAVVTATLMNSSSINCPYTGPWATTAICPPWTDIQSISITAIVPPAVSFLNVMVGCEPGSLYSMGIPLLRGSSLFGRLTWSQREAMTHPGDTTYLIYTPQIDALQPNTSIQANITSLTLQQFSPYPIKHFRDTVDTSALSGIATFGGFWTFVNGTFALFFGANVVYFAFGRRPLSALGVVHLFQRRALVRRWYEDFPAIRTEGGLPGSENAGIVAFIRERLVDLGEDPQDIKQSPRVKKRPPKNGKLRRWARRKGAQLPVSNSLRKNYGVVTRDADVEEQMLPAASVYTELPLDEESWEDVNEKVKPQSATLLRHPGYILDSIP